MLAAFALTTGKDAVKNEDLAEQLEKARQESAEFRHESSKLRQESAELRQQLEKSKEETKEIIQRENQKLTAEAAKLRAIESKLRKENKKLRRQDEELRKRDAELAEKVNELHRDNSEVKKALRQRDENSSLEVQDVVRNSFGFRQMDFTSELRNTINKQIKEYLDENKMCVMGKIEQELDDSGYDNKDAKIEFGQTFPRIPAFAAALSTVGLKTSPGSGTWANQARAQVYDFRVTKSSAEVKIQGWQCYRAHFIWMACM